MFRLVNQLKDKLLQFDILHRFLFFLLWEPKLFVIYISCLNFQQDAPTLSICYSNGRMQIMRNESDESKCRYFCNFYSFSCFRFKTNKFHSKRFLMMTWFEKWQLNNSFRSSLGRHRHDSSWLPMESRREHSCSCRNHVCSWGSRKRLQRNSGKMPSSNPHNWWSLSFKF